MASFVGVLYGQSTMYHEAGPCGIASDILVKPLLWQVRVGSGVRSDCDIFCIGMYQTDVATNNDIYSVLVFDVSPYMMLKMTFAYCVTCM